MKTTHANEGDSIFFSCGKLKQIEASLSLARQKIAKDLNLIDKDIFAFCWIVDSQCLKRTKLQIKLNLVTILSQCRKVI